MVSQIFVSFSIFKVVLSFLVNRSTMYIAKKEKPEWQINLNCNMLLFVSFIFFVVWGKITQMLTFRKYNKVKSPKGAVVLIPAGHSLPPISSLHLLFLLLPFPLTFQTNCVLCCSCKVPCDRIPLGLCVLCPSVPCQNPMWCWRPSSKAFFSIRLLIPHSSSDRKSVV